MTSHRVKTAHIRKMLREAEKLAKHAEEGSLTGDYDPSDGLARAANLAEHAAAELRDELFQTQGWPTV